MKKTIIETNVVEDVSAIDDNELDEMDYCQMDMVFSEILQDVINKLEELKEDAKDNGYEDSNLLDNTYYNKKDDFKEVIKKVIVMQRLFKKYAIGDKNK